MGERVDQKDVAVDDVFGLITKSSKTLRDDLKETQTELNKLAASFVKVSKSADIKSQKGLNEVTKANAAATKAKKKQSDLDKILIKDAKLLEKARLEEIRTQVAREKAVDRFNKKEEIAIKQARRKKKALLDNSNAYQILTARVNRAEGEFKKLAAQYGVNSIQAKKARREFDKLDRELRQVNDAARDGRRDVGRYGLALQGVRGNLLRMGAALGLVGGGLAIFRNAFGTIRDFEQGQADLASVLADATIPQLEMLEKQTKLLGATTTFTATEVAGLQKEFAKLGFNPSEIENMTEATLLLAEATGTDLAEAASVTGGTMNAFGLASTETQRVVDVMAKSFSKSGLDMEKFSETMKNAAPIAKATGVSFEVATAAAGKLADANISGSKAGTDLKKIFSELVKDGKPFEESLNDIAEQMDGASTKAEKLAIAEALVGDRAKGALLILAEQRDGLSELAVTLEDAEGAAKKMADTQRNTLGGALKLLSSAWDGFILSMNEAGGVGEKLRNTIAFLAENLGTILSVLGNLIIVLVAYKTRLIALNIAQKIFNTESGKMSFNLKNVAKNLKESAKEGKGLGSVLKNIGWAAAIAGAFKLAQGFFEIANGARQAAFDTNQMNKEIASGAELTNKKIDNLRKERDLALSLAKTDDDRLVIQQDFIKSMRGTKDGVIELLRAEKFRNAELQKVSDSTDGYTRLLIEQADAYRDIFVEGDDFDDLLGKSNATIAKYQASIDLLGGSITDAKIETTHFTETINANTSALEDEEKAIKDTTRALTELGVIRQKERDTSKISRASEALDEAQAAIDARKRGVAEIRLIDAQQDKDEEEIAAARIIQIQTNLAIETQFLKDGSVERIRLEKQAALEISKIEDGITAKKNAEQKQRLKDIRDTVKEVGDELADAAIEQSQQRQSILDREIAASQALEDRLRESAKSQNADASESLAAQEDITREKIQAKQREAKKEALLEEAKAIWNAINNFMDQGDSLPKATAKGFAGVVGIKQLVNSLSGFFKGTKGKLKDEHSPFMSGKDGHIIRADGNEMIFNGDQVDELSAAGINTTADTVKSAIMNKQLTGDTGAIMAYNVASNSGTMSTAALERKLDAVEKAIKDTAFSLDPVFIKGALAGAVSEKNKGSVKERHLYLTKR